MIRNLVEQIHVELMERIMAGQMQMGERVYEERLADAFGVSRGAVREATRLLEQEGLVHRTPHRGVFVANPPPQEICDAVELRIRMEGWAVERSGRPAEEKLEGLGRIALEIEQAIASGDHAGLVGAEIRFHQGIVALGGNQVLRRKHRELDGMIALLAYRLLSMRAAAALGDNRHRQLLDALRKSDHSSFLRTVEEHYGVLIERAETVGH